MQREIFRAVFQDFSQFQDLDKILIVQIQNSLESFVEKSPLLTFLQQRQFYNTLTLYSNSRR
jgi:hypothetical protein